MKKRYLLFICTATFLFLNCKKDDGSLPVDDNPSEEVENPETDIFDFSPALGGWGTKVTIRGENFDPLPEGNQVQFNGRMAEVESASETTLVAIVPEDATTGKISLFALGYDYTSFQDFTVLLPPPIINDFEPKEGVEGDEVTITGDHFGDNPSAVDVLFHGAETPAELKSFSDTKIVVRVPDGYKGPIQMRVKDQYTISEDEFTYLPWRRRADFEEGKRRFGIAEAIEDKIYMGFGNYGSAKKDLWEYDPELDSWTQMTDFPGEARHGVFHFVIDGLLYVGGGTNGTSQTGPNDFYSFDPATNTWTSLGDFPGNPNQVRRAPSTFTINDKGYVYGGTNLGIDLFYNDLWEYNPTNDSWEEKSGFEDIGRASAVSFSIGNKGYISTGFYSQTQLLSDIWEYSPQSDSWTEKEPLPDGNERYGAIGFSIRNKGYVGLGFNNNYQQQANLWEFDSSDNYGEGSWTLKTTFSSSYRQWPFAAASANEKAYIGLGMEYINNVFEFPTDIWEYTPRHDE
ncbi:Kelch repeat-containing protein [Flagellimonas flava]|uniref:Kelch repeat-containing protein n=1 Tax=Flagellimonas flava TaxID=570519 RepID=UPI003D64CF28